MIVNLMYTLQTVFFSNYSYRVSLCLEYVRHVYVLTQLITLYTITMLWDLRNIPKTHESRSSEWKWEHLHKHIRFELRIHIFENDNRTLCNQLKEMMTFAFSKSI